MHNALQGNVNTERRKHLRMKFFDASRTKAGFQALHYRIGGSFDILTN